MRNKNANYFLSMTILNAKEHLYTIVTLLKWREL